MMNMLMNHNTMVCCKAYDFTPKEACSQCREDKHDIMNVYSVQ